MERQYFSDRESGPRPRPELEVGPKAWRGLVGITQSLINDGSFGIDFPKYCQDCSRSETVGTDVSVFALVVQGEIDIEWPLRTVKFDDIPFGSPTSEPYVPPTSVVLDFIEFCHQHVADLLEKVSYHDSIHYHLSFDREGGQESYRSQINNIFARNGIAYELRPSGTVERLAPPVLQEALESVVFHTGDAILDDLLERARSKFLSHDPDARGESLEKLWDAWERVKSLHDPANKKLSVPTLLDRVASEPSFRVTLETEARELTRIGNDFQIRHSEVGKPVLQDSLHVDYLFHRLFAFIRLVIGN